MKQWTILFLTALTLLAACKKDKGPDNTGFHPDYFIFGKNQTNCRCNIVGVSYYMTDSNKLYSEQVPGQLFLKGSVMPDSDYLKVKALMDQFPAYLLSHPNTSIGCDSSETNADVLNITAIINADTTRWHINPDDTTLPAEIQPYINQMQQTWSGLWH